MSTASQQSKPTPERFFNAVNAHQQTEAIKSAIELELFTAIAEGHNTSEALATRCKVAERGARILCDFLTIHGFLTKSGSQYTLAADTAIFLSKLSPAYLGTAVEFLLAPRIREAHAQLTAAVRHGGTALGEGTLEPENPDWVKFAQAMMPLMFMPAEIVAAQLLEGGPVHKVLDIAAGHGIYGIAVAKKNPEAQVFASDWKNVLEVAKQNAAAMGVSDRYHLLPGSAFETDLGGGYDLVLIPNFLHHFDKSTCTAFMQKIHTSLTPDGRVAILEFVPNFDRVSPPAAAFAMMMLATTPSGDAYTFDELETISKDAGFSSATLSPAEIGMERLIVAHR